MNQNNSYLQQKTISDNLDKEIRLKQSKNKYFQKADFYKTVNLDNEAIRSNWSIDDMVKLSGIKPEYSYDRNLAQNFAESNPIIGPAIKENLNLTNNRVKKDIIDRYRSTSELSTNDKFLANLGLEANNGNYAGANNQIIKKSGGSLREHKQLDKNFITDLELEANNHNYSGNDNSFQKKSGGSLSRHETLYADRIKRDIVDKYKNKDIDISKEEFLLNAEIEANSGDHKVNYVPAKNSKIQQSSSPANTGVDYKTIANLELEANPQKIDNSIKNGENLNKTDKGFLDLELNANQQDYKMADSTSSQNKGRTTDAEYEAEKIKAEKAEKSVLQRRTFDVPKKEPLDVEKGTVFSKIGDKIKGLYGETRGKVFGRKEDDVATKIREEIVKPARRSIPLGEDDQKIQNLQLEAENVVSDNKIHNAKSDKKIAGKLGKYGKYGAIGLAGLGVSGGLVLALSDNRGHQSNAQLYGQQPLY